MEIEQTKFCTAENNNHTYPFISRPAAGTLCYPFRRIAKGVSSRIAKAFLIRLREWLPVSSHSQGRLQPYCQGIPYQAEGVVACRDTGAR